MSILEDLISILNFDAAVKDIRQGIFHTGVLTRNCGLAATLPRDALRQKPPMVKEPGFLLDKDPKELVQLANSPNILEAAMGMATINSLLEIKMDSCIELNAAELIKEKGIGKRIAIVGHFPFIPKVREIAQAVWVMEKNPEEGDLHETEAENFIPRAHIVAITGTALTNHTLDHLLELCRPEAYVILLGDTVPLTPVLFDYQVDAISGTKVVNPDLALKCVSQGANFRQIKGIKKLTMVR